MLTVNTNITLFRMTLSSDSLTKVSDYILVDGEKKYLRGEIPLKVSPITWLSKK